MSPPPEGIMNFYDWVYEPNPKTIIVKSRKCGMRSLLEAQRILAMAEQHCINMAPKIKGEVVNVRRL